MRARTLVIAAVCTIAAGIGAFTATGQSTSNFYERTEVARVNQGFRIAPVPLKYTRANKYYVGLGSYIVNGVASCADCHTQPPYAAGGNPYMGQPKKINTKNYLAGGQAFGPFVSRNITPEKNGLPAGLTYTQFVQVMRHGTDFDHAHPQYGPLLQVMPWPVFQSMSDNDLRAIYEYLKAVPPAQPGK